MQLNCKNKWSSQRRDWNGVQYERRKKYPIRKSCKYHIGIIDEQEDKEAAITRRHNENVMNFTISGGA